MVFNTSPAFPPGSSFGNFPAPHDLDPAYMTQAFNIGVTGCLRCVREVVPKMLERGSGTILLSGATMALRGGPQFAWCVILMTDDLIATAPNSAVMDRDSQSPPPVIFEDHHHCFPDNDAMLLCG